ncbi:energy-coupling factor ABC transporter ATP-binding protein [Paenibacillus sp. SC116]|uniref:ABC transporter ATP-binding protein n=1 Tax=Paenibacillus sp. SC116 TaxID=2968986 RepID=UPI00215AF293|nr:ABC transporter ATP-binding protein [Paenibacillus sp. SC116]MCR8842759.1 energy-coupling factor ABC transporter ATP-binding protein [Paenibacillus sp. SC116]
MNISQLSPDLSITNLRLKFAGESSFIFKDLSFAVPQGQKILLLGPSGCGKSTLLQVLSGIIPASFEVPMKADAIQNPYSWGFVFQDPDTQFCMPMVDEELAFVLENLSVPREQMKSRMHSVLEMVGLHLDELHIPIQSFSQGMKQRLALATVLLLNPEVLFLDEPSALLDPDGTIQIWKAIKNIANEKTVIIVEHKIEHVISYVDRVVLFNDQGEIIVDDTRDIVFSNYKEKLVQYGIWYPGVWQDYSQSDTYQSIMQEKHVHNQSLPISAPSREQSPLLLLQQFAGYRENQRRIYIGEATLHAGEWIAITGENGAGKSTFLLSLMQLLTTDGTYLIEGQPIVQSKKRLNKLTPPNQLAFVFQNPEMQFVTDSVYDEIAFSLQLENRPQADIDQIVTELLSSFHLHVSEDRHPYQLSMGQKRRLSVASAIVQNQPIVLLDEPTFGLDAKSTFVMLERLEQLRVNGVSILMITHDPHIIHYFCDQVWGIHEGELSSISKVNKANTASTSMHDDNFDADMTESHVIHSEAAAERSK